MENNQIETKRRQELHCHACGRYVQFELDLSLNGNHVLNCPNCGHEHCRVVQNGEITDTRWDRRNGPPGNGLPVYFVTTASTTTTSVFDTMGVTTDAGTGSAFLANAWFDSGTSAIGTSAYTGGTVI